MVILWEGKGVDEKELVSLDALKFKKMVISNVNYALSDKFPFYREVIYMRIGFQVKS